MQSSRRSRRSPKPAHPEAEQQAGRHYQQHDHIHADKPGLCILPKQLAIEGGRVPLVDVTGRGPRAPLRGRAAVARRAAIALRRKLDDFGLSAGLLIKQQKSCTQPRLFTFAICGA